MSLTIRASQDELDNVESLRTVASALFDTSAEKISDLRANFVKNQAFYSNIARLYSSVKQTAMDHDALPARAKGVARTVRIAFTSNTRFYGSVNREVMDVLIDEMSRSKGADYVVIGRTGQAYKEQLSAAKVNVSYYVFAGDEPTRKEIQTFLESVSAYEEVFLVYPAFLNIFAHSVEMRDIAYSARDESDPQAQPTFDYIFEPELSKILTFFETKVRYLLFQRAMLESELARTSARLLSMNLAQQRADTEAMRLERTIKRARANFNDARLLESFAARSVWQV